MGREQLVREIKAAALARMEDAARTEGDFKKIIEQWNHLDENRERRERYHEIGRPNAEMLHWDKIPICTMRLTKHQKAVLEV